MTFAFTIQGRQVFGNLKVLYGTFTNTDMDAGGDIDLTRELHQVDLFFAQGTGSASSTTCVLNETFPADPVISIVCEIAGCGIWMGLGR
jgi:hypothetical protein